MPVKRQVFGHAFRKQDVTAVAAIHHPLRDVDPGASDIRAVVHIRRRANWSAVNADANGELRLIPQRFTDFDRATHRRLGATGKDQRHAVAGR